MTYIIETWDKKDHQNLRNQLTLQHHAYLNQQLTCLIASADKVNENSGVVTGSFYILNVKNHLEAQQFIQADPLFVEGLLQKIKIERLSMQHADQSILM